MNRFTPGMTCPGWRGRACNAVLRSKRDRDHRRLLCKPCGEAAAIEIKQEWQAKYAHKCLDCPATCLRAAQRCRKCGQRHSKAEQLRLRKERAQVPSVPSAHFVPAGRWEDWAADRLMDDPRKARVVDACLKRLRGQSCQP